MAHLVTTLRVARARFASWPGSGGDDRRALPDSFDTMAGGVERVYRRGRRAMARAIADPQEAKVHEWRKRVKYLRHQTEAIQGAWPAVLGPLAGALDDLGELLGLEHDLAVLDEAVRSDPGLLPEPSRRKVLHAVIEIERDLLQQQAFAIGRRVYVEPPGRFLERVGAYWGTWRSEG